MSNFCSGDLVAGISKILQTNFINADLESYYLQMISEFDSTTDTKLKELEIGDLKGVTDFLNSKTDLKNLGIDFPIYFGNHTQNKNKIMIVAMDAKRTNQIGKKIVLGSVFNLHNYKGRTTNENDYWKFVEPLLEDNFVYLTDIFKIYYETSITQKGSKSTLLSNKDKDYTTGKHLQLNKTILEQEINLVKPNSIIALGNEAASALRSIQEIPNKDNYLTKNGIEYIFMPHISRTVTQSIPTIANLFISLGKIKKIEEFERLGNEIHNANKIRFQ